MYKADARLVLRCGHCNKPFDKGEWYLHEVLLHDSKRVLIVPWFRGHAEETWILLSISTSSSHHSVSSLCFLCERKGALR